MARRVLYAYVLRYNDGNSGRRLGRIFCSPTCGNNTLEYPPASWDTMRAQVSHALRDAIVCEGCGLTIREAYEEEELPT